MCILLIHDMKQNYTFPLQNPYVVLNDFKVNCAVLDENFPFLTRIPTPLPLSHSNRQLGRLFIDPLLPSA